MVAVVRATVPLLKAVEKEQQIPEKKRRKLHASSSSSKTTRTTRLHLLLLFLLVVAIESRKTRLTWVNGIAYLPIHMEEGEVFISKLFGGEKVRFCYNPTKQVHDEDTYGYLSDLTQAGTQKLGVVTAEVNTLAQFLKESVAAVGRKGVVVHIAHSQGALITALASKQLTPLEMSQIEVLTFGGAAAIRKTTQTPFRRCVNYYSVNDPLLLVVPLAAQALRSGLVSDEEFVFLMPRMGDPISDHNLIGETYAQALEWEGKRFQMSHRSLLHRLLKPIIVALLAFASSLAHRLDESLKTVLRHILKWCIICYSTCKVYFDLFVSKVNEKVWRPLLAVMALLVEWIMVQKRFVTGEDKYVPVSPELMVGSTDKTATVQKVTTAVNSQ